MLILNFAHPFKEKDIEIIEQLCEQPVSDIRELASQINVQAEIGPQIEKMLDSAGLNAHQWQSEAMVINLPSLSVSAAVLLAQIHGRTGYFPAIIRTRPMAGAMPPGYEVADILNLQEMRNNSREKRDHEHKEDMANDR